MASATVCDGGPGGLDVERHLAADQARRQVADTTLASVTVGRVPPRP